MSGVTAAACPDCGGHWKESGGTVEGRSCPNAYHWDVRRDGGIIICAYCFNAPAHHDPVLGWICVPCEREITQGDDDAD